MKRFAQSSFRKSQRKRKIVIDSEESEESKDEIYVP